MANPDPRFGRVIREARAGETLEAIAKRCHTHKGYVSGIENGKVNPPAWRMVDRLARALDLDGADLLELAVVCKAPAPIRERMLSRIHGSNRYHPMV